MIEAHVNDIKAKPNNVILLIGAALGILVTVFLWSYFGAIGTISIIIPVLISRQQTNEAKAFNSYMIRRK